jgi:type IV pilus assembly protein PilB
VETFAEVARRRNEPLWETLLRENRITESWLADLYAQRLKIPLVALTTHLIDPEAAHRIPETVARKYLCVPFAWEGRFLKVAFVDPSNLAAVQAVEFYTGCKVKPVVAPRTHVLETISHVFSESQAIDIIDQATERTELQILPLGEDLDLDLDKTAALQAAQIPPIIKLVNLVITEALRARASDIHIEPSEHEIRIRLRVDGVLRDFLRTPAWLHPGLTTRLKVVSKLDIAEKRLPQDGRFKVHFQNAGMDVRISTLPTQFGEKVVMRLLGSGEGIPPAEKLGIHARDLGALLEAAMQPQGIIMVTGPTGSGKTTTLYSLLNHKRSSEVSIVTVEDPIEYHLEGVNQVQVNVKTGLTFSSCLRSILRQDPDVILVGEIRDRETAEIAFHAAMTGHMVLTSLHTNSSIATVLRLLDLGVDPFVITSSVTLIIAQRLARVTCDQCREIYTPAARLLRRLRWDDPNFVFTRGRGCKACHGTGFKGRIGIYEILKMTNKVVEAINAKGSEADIRKAALSSDFVTLMQDAREKIHSGMTTPNEVLRVIEWKDEAEASCSRCGQPVSVETGRCTSCTDSAHVLCGGCGQELAVDWQACPRCATPVPRERPQSSVPQTSGAEAGLRGVPEGRGKKGPTTVQ